MATRPFEDDRPLYWELKGGRHNALSRHRGMQGLWYLVGTWGQGRYQDGWSLLVFPDHIRVSGYAGRSVSRILTEGLKAQALLSLEGQGGRDYGKSFMSKGGYRPGGSIPYRLQGKEFDPALLQDGDEFLRQVLRWEPTAEGIREGLARQAEEAAVKAAAEKALLQKWSEEREAETAARQEARARYEVLFAGVEIPQGFFHDITAEGLSVWHEYQGSSSPWGNRYDQVTLQSLKAYQEWLVATRVKLQKEEGEAQERAKVREREDAERRAREEQKAAEEAAITAHLDELDDLLSNL